MKILKKISKFFLITVVILGLLFAASFFIRTLRVTKENMQMETEHFNIHYKGILKGEAEDIAETLETNYNRIRTELDDPEHNMIQVFIHPTQKEFNQATGLPNSTANGTSRGPMAFHLKYETWYNTFLPSEMEKVAVHEFTHCVQLNILIKDALSRIDTKSEADFDKEFEQYFSANYPQWFWEALSDYEAGIVNRLSVNHGMKNHPTLTDLNTSNQIYNVGYTIVEYLVHAFGKEKLPEFIRSYCNYGKVLNVSEKEFEKGWQQFVEENY
ncbi:MAG: hypothetical protein R2819_09260 [Allomuricauda sp.]